MIKTAQEKADIGGNAYTIARIIEFLPANTTPKKGTKHTGELQVRVALYYRPTDIWARHLSDSRLLLAAIHTDTQPLSNVRGKCYVWHKDRIDDLIEWKRKPDHFYFIKFFDPYIKREFEVIRTETVKNIPVDVKQALLSRYEYLITEKEMVADLTDDFRSCIVCDQWAASQDSVRCETCKNSYHMACMNPPLSAKPAKGYSWVCLPCSMQRRKDVQDQKFIFTSNGPAPSRPNKVNGKVKDKQKFVGPRRPDVTHRGWPWRYFGQVAFFRPSHLHVMINIVDSYMEEVSKMRLAVPPYDLERLNKAVGAYTAHGREKALTIMRNARLEDFSPVLFTQQETQIFQQELDKWGGLDAHEIAKVLGKRPSEVLRFSYMWKNKQLASENEAIRQHQKVTHAHARQSQTLGAPSLGKIRTTRDSSGSDDEVSLYGSATRRMQCAACSTRLGTVWWRCPRSLPGKAMCETCGSNYRKYGVISFVKAEDSKRPEKKERELKKSKGEASGTATPVPTPAPKLPPCAMCKRMEPKSSMARCKTCTFSVHSVGCYGIEPQEMGSNWECELCLGQRETDDALHPRCVLCPAQQPPIPTKRKRLPMEFDMLSALKPTEGRRWAHILCSVWQSDVVFTTPTALKSVEGISTLSRESWMGQCTLCQREDGAKVDCAECGVRFHASCAWLAGYKFGFEFSLAKAGKRESVNITKFKEETGIMSSQIYCKSHDITQRTLYDPHEIDPEQNETALQTYVSAYKGLPLQGAFPLLRKAQRLDLFISSPEERVREKICAGCGTDVSPLWYRSPRLDEMDVDMDLRVEQKMKERVMGFEDICHLCKFTR
ncbi:hypothetical protein TREMEDRAFT_31780 [Tremella mesenterica DSM 1558]|uniref:uncharacterized protein n=1 Tax=Tremella mesenterica (strain ATCC 24925 / CBS 8224 / DSM 1558 / NBRC 9311 / NRRL Y-6157 / RJB 2259-6 / UBC 559-6) TaxID=578456 RepID=UPI0003F48C5C|nr:uncharacterized protein TREMEDRAFT_31780 [Tremella mesenterica DSM 1558]EIW68698.1 hypothetical protein TREMEDRAFT_31780 [Tremella mesenterica DSM 1558]